MALELLAEKRLLCSDASSEGKGLWAFGSVATNINRSDQVVQMPQQQDEQQRRKIFGIF